MTIDFIITCCVGMGYDFGHAGIGAQITSKKFMRELLIS